MNLAQATAWGDEKGPQSVLDTSSQREFGIA